MGSELSVGIVGAGGGMATNVAENGVVPHDDATIRAVCDTDETTLRDAMERLDAEEAYRSYSEMLEESSLDAVMVMTPQNLHAPQAVAALERDLHVMSAVPAAVDLEQSRELVEAVRDSGAQYMLGEDCLYYKENLLVNELVDDGLFGELYYAEGNYIHDLKGLVTQTPWRRTWQVGIDGITYPTHQLGPILEWLDDDRIAEVSCVGSGHHHVDEEGRRFEQQDTTVMECQTAHDRLVRIRLDLLSDRPTPGRPLHYQLQGTDGYYESPVKQDDGDRIWLKDCHGTETPHERTARPLSEFDGELPDRYLNPPDAAQRAGHFGSDYFMTVDFIDAVVAGEPVPTGIHRAMDMTIPGLVSQESIERDGEWLPVPDSRTW